MDFVSRFAEHIVAVQYETFPPEALLTSKLSILDTLDAAIMALHRRR
jgi:hypothetical protein